MPTRPPRGSSENTVPVYILAGGRSRRFGSDKARAVVDGKPLLVGLAESLGDWTERVTVVAGESGAYADLGLRTIADLIPGKGPLGGLLTAMDDHGQDGWVFIAACDWVGIRGEWLGRLLGERGAVCHAILFESTRDQPLFGLYHTSVRDTVAGRIAQNRLKMLDFLDEIDVVIVPPPTGWQQALNMNRPIRPD